MSDYESESDINQILDSINENFSSAAKVEFTKRRPNLSFLGIPSSKRRYLTPTSSFHEDIILSGVEDLENTSFGLSHSFSKDQDVNEDRFPLLRIRKPSKRELSFLDAVNDPDFFNKENEEALNFRTIAEDLFTFEQSEWIKHNPTFRGIKSTLDGYFAVKKDYLFDESKLLKFLSLGSFYQEKSELISIQRQFKKISAAENILQNAIRKIQPIVIKSGETYKQLSILENKIKYEESEIYSLEREYEETNMQLKEVESNIEEIELKIESQRQSLSLKDSDFPSSSYYHSLKSLNKDLTLVDKENNNLELQIQKLQDDIERLETSAISCEKTFDHPSFRAFNKAIDQLTKFSPNFSDSAMHLKPNTTIDVLINKLYLRLEELLKLSNLLNVNLDNLNFFSKVVRSLVDCILKAGSDNFKALNLSSTALIISYILKILQESAELNPKGLVLDQLKQDVCKSLNVDRSIVSSTIYSMLARKLVSIDTSDLELLISLTFSF